MAIDKAALETALDQLTTKAAELAVIVTTLSDEQVQEKYNSVDRAIAAVDRLVVGEGEATPFDGFLRSIGQSVVQAQEDIDIESRKYMLGVKDKPYAQPSMFRIPSVKAEMKFALEKTSSESLGLIFYRRTQQAREQHQQSLSFEIKAVPPTPEMVKALLHDAPGIRLELDPVTRQAILDRVAALPGGDPALTRAPDRPRVLIWGPGDVGDYFLFRATTASNGKLGVWHFKPMPGDAADTIAAVLPYVQEPQHAPLRLWVAKLAEAQVKYLTELG